jgi:hypothetical protein
MRARSRDRKVKIRMPPCSVDMMEWMYRSSMGFNKSFAIRSATPASHIEKTFKDTKRKNGTWNVTAMLEMLLFHGSQYILL